jgi:hypothetical protein
MTTFIGGKALWRTRTPVVSEGWPVSVRAVTRAPVKQRLCPPSFSSSVVMTADATGHVPGDPSPAPFEMTRP